MALHANESQRKTHVACLFINVVCTYIWLWIGDVTHTHNRRTILSMTTKVKRKRIDDMLDFLRKSDRAITSIDRICCVARPIDRNFCCVYFWLILICLFSWIREHQRQRDYCSVCCVCLLPKSKRKLYFGNELLFSLPISVFSSLFRSGIIIVVIVASHIVIRTYLVDHETTKRREIWLEMMNASLRMS